MRVKVIVTLWLSIGYGTIQLMIFSRYSELPFAMLGVVSTAAAVGCLVWIWCLRPSSGEHEDVLRRVFQGRRWPF